MAAPLPTAAPPSLRNPQLHKQPWLVGSSVLCCVLGQDLCHLCPLKGGDFANKIGVPYSVRALLSQRKPAEFQGSSVSSQMFDAVIIYTLLTAWKRAETLLSKLRA